MFKNILDVLKQIRDQGGVGGGGGGDASAANQTDMLSRIGEVQASPTANTVLDRLKTIATNVSNLLTGIVLAAGSNLIGKVIAHSEIGSLYDGTTALPVKFKFVNVAASQTDSAVVAAVALKKIRVLSLAMVTGTTATNVTFNSKPGGAGTAISATFANAANGGLAHAFEKGLFETAAGEGLSVTTGAGSTTGIQITYVEV